MSEVHGFVLAGGRSSRMGEHKAMLLLGGRSLVELACEKLRAVTRQVRIVGPKKKLGEDAVEDIFPGRGPLGGIHAALKVSSAELNVILAVDLPLVQENLLKYVVRQAEECKAVVVAPRTEDGYQPLCAVYRREFVTAAEGALQAGQNKIDALFDKVQARVIDSLELARAGISGEQFRNVNTPAEFEAARLHMAAK